MESSHGMPRANLKASSKSPKVASAKDLHSVYALSCIMGFFYRFQHFLGSAVTNPQSPLVYNGMDNVHFWNRSSAASLPRNMMGGKSSGFYYPNCFCSVVFKSFPVPPDSMFAFLLMH